MKLEPGDMLLALARDLSEARTTLSSGLEGLAGRLEALEGAEYGDAIAGLRKVLGDVAEAVQELQDKAEEEEPEGPGTAPDWTNLDKEQCQELWDWLNTWCSKILLPVYVPDAWRPCWYAPPAAAGRADLAVRVLALGVREDSATYPGRRMARPMVDACPGES